MPARADRQALGWAQRLVTLVTRRGACHLPDGAAAFVASALATFADEIRQHAAAGHRAGGDDRVSPRVGGDQLGQQLDAHPVRLAGDRVHPQAAAHLHCPQA